MSPPSLMMSPTLALAEFTTTADDIVTVTIAKNQRSSITAGVSRMTNNLPASGGHSVRIGNVIIREYERTLGDNLCSSGPPVGIGWNYWASGTICSTNTTITTTDPATSTSSNGSTSSGSQGQAAETELVLPVEMYEQLRGPPIPSHKLILSRATRDSILTEHGFSREQISEAVRQNIRIKNQRRQTLTNLKLEPYEEFTERLAKGMKKAFFLDRKKREKSSTRPTGGTSQNCINYSCVSDGGTRLKGILIQRQESV
jgi:hypothetical protein